MQGQTQQQADYNDDLTKSNSVVFNTFIFMQVCSLFTEMHVTVVNLWVPKRNTVVGSCGVHLTRLAQILSKLHPTFSVHVQLFNQINARKINDELNVFSGIIHSHLFIYIWILEAGLQVRGSFP